MAESIKLSEEMKQAIRASAKEWATAEIKIANLKEEQKDICKAIASKLDVKESDVSFAFKTAFKGNEQDYTEQFETRDAILDVISS